jgi:hypothetical protein
LRKRLQLDDENRAERWKSELKKRMLVSCCMAAVCIIGVLGYKGYEYADRAVNAGPGQLVAGSVTDSGIYHQLDLMQKEEKKIGAILEHYEEYPEELLDMLTRNMAMLDFVLDYPQKKGQVFADSIGEVTKGEVPLLLQWDERWGYGDYGTSSVAVSGCAPTALSMVIAGLTGENRVTPYTVAQYAQENGYYVPGVGTSWDLMEEGARQFGVEGTKMKLSEHEVMTMLQFGYPIICSMMPGDFTTSGHFIVLSALEDGKIRVKDPNSAERSEKLWDYETLESQIKGLWVFIESK